MKIGIEKSLAAGRVRPTIFVAYRHCPVLVWISVGLVSAIKVLDHCFLKNTLFTVCVLLTNRENNQFNIVSLILTNLNTQKTYIVLAYTSGQNGVFLPARDYALCPARKFCSLIFIDQACSVKMAWYWSRSFIHLLRFFARPRLRTWTTDEKKILGQNPVILTSRLLNIL